MHSDSIQGSIFCKIMLEETKTCDNIYAVGNAYRTAGIFYLFYLDYTNAILNFNKALEIYGNIDDENGKIGYAKTCYNYGLLFEFNADYEVELELYQNVAEIFIEHKLYNYLISLYTRYITIYNKLGDFEKEREYNRNVIQIATEIEDDYSLMSVYLSYASLYVDNMQYDSAAFYFEKMKKTSEKIGSYDGLGNYYYNYAYMESQQGNFNNALKLLFEGYKIAKLTDNLNDDIEIYYKFGLCYKSLENYQVARDTLLVGIELAEKHGFKELNRKMLEIISEVEEATGNYQKALEYRKKYNILYQETLNEEKLNQIAYLEAKFEATQKENEIKKLSEENLINELKLNKQNIVIFALIIVLIALITATYFILRHIITKKRLAEKEAELQKNKIEKLEKEHQLSAMKYALQGEETERHRISKDLHDGIGGLLSGIKLTLSNMKGNYIINEEGVQQFDKAISLLDDSIKELRRVAHNMMPEALVKFGLQVAITDFCENISLSKKINAVFQHFGDEKRLEQKLEVNIYRIIQELSNNTIKYAEAKNLQIQMIIDGNRVSLTVNDDGKGFNTKILQTSKGMGFANIKSRVELFNGKLEINSIIGEGTEIFIEFIT
jgi:signal transduction histidine kinase